MSTDPTHPSPAHAAGPARKAAGTPAVLLSLLLTVAATAQPTDPSGFPFLRLEPSARAAALGGAFVSVPDAGVDGLFYNPALLQADHHRSLSLSYLNHLTDVNGGFAAFAFDVPSIGTFGGGLRYLNWGTIESATETGERTGEFSAGDVALTVGLGRPYGDRLRYGGSVHLVYSSFDSFSASAVAADLGAIYVVPASRLSLSVALNNLGVTLSSLGGTRDELPVDLRLGVSHRLAHLPLLISVTAYNLHDLDAASTDASVADNVLHHLAFGGELRFGEALRARFGYNHRRHTELKTKNRLDFAGVGMGVGIRIRRFQFDYAYNSWSSLGGLNQLTLGTVL